MTEEDNNIDYLDEKEFMSRFFLDPDINDDADFTHIDKNLAITNLRYEKGMNSINEPEQMRSLHSGLHILNPSMYFKTILIKVLAGYREAQYKDKDGNPVIVQVPVYKMEEKKVNRFPKTFHSLKAAVHSFQNTAASRGGHRVKAANTRHRTKEETIEERNTVNSKWSGYNGRRN